MNDQPAHSDSAADERAALARAPGDFAEGEECTIPERATSRGEEEHGAARLRDEESTVPEHRATYT